jgi:hypothetical protein
VSRFTANVLVAIAMLRADDAAAHLLDLALTAHAPLASQALDALGAHAASPTLIERVRALADRRPTDALTDRLRRFPAR